MIVETPYGPLTARPVTLSERRNLAAHLSSVWTQDAHGPVQNPANLGRLCDLAEKLLDADSRAALEKLPVYEQNAALISVAAKLVEGVSGEGSGA